MPITTDLSRAPYFDDYNEKDNYHRILFKPSVAVQVRELNQLQTILQNQIERFGDNVYKRGTIIDGCNIIFHPNLNYVKINDIQTDGAPVNISSFKGFFARNNNDVKAQIVEVSSGFESTPPNLNTLHVKYLNTGVNSDSPFFKVGEQITIYDPALIVSEADVQIKSKGFSNSDNLVVLSAVEVSNTIGGDSFVNSSGQACTFIVGETITQDVTGAQAQIMEVNSTANVDTLILKIRPLASNLRIANNTSWLFYENYQFSSSQTNITGILKKNIGKDAFGTIVTDTENGGIKSVAILNGGTGYYVEPWLTVSYSISNTNPSTIPLIDGLKINCKTFLCNVTVNENITSIGTGVGISVSEGIIYQKGHFVRVSDQFIVVDKYNAQTNNVVGFDTVEEIINFRLDEKLLDNASGALNEKAPGADRLKLTPKLVSTTKEIADANNIFLPIIEYTLGKPARQRRTTQFNSISKELAQRTFEQSGNYVLDQFLISTEDIDDVEQNSTTYRVKADPGTAYIDGYRVQTFAPVTTDASKGIDVSPAQQTSLSLTYGNFIKITDVAGFFNFSGGDVISLRSAVKDYITSSLAGQGSAQFPEITAAGEEIGTAKIRSMDIERGMYGGQFAIHKLYIFDIKMKKGKNFKDVRSIFYNGSSANKRGTADLVLENGNAIVYGAKNSTLLFPSGLQALKSVNSVSYTYRATNDNTRIATNGRVSVSVAQNPGESLAYQSILSNDEKATLYLLPLANGEASSLAAGVHTVTGGSGNVTATGAAVYNVAFRPGDYIKVANSTGDFEIKRISKIANATHLSVYGTFTNNLGVSTIRLFFPQYVPVQLPQSRRTANVQSNTILTINIGNTISQEIPAALMFDVRKSSNSVPKRITRNAFVKIYPELNEGGLVGPWCLGLPDIIRLKEVYEGRTTTFVGNTTVVASNTINFNNDYLVNGTSVIYATATGSGVITGLSNNQTYYVVNSSSSGVKLALTSGGSEIALTGTATDTTQYLMSVTNNNIKVTSNFYIDHNQRKDYYDLGYLYKQTSYSIPTKKVFLAQFDVMTTNENGIKTISSYPIVDNKNLIDNTAGIHTLEIPEIIHDNGEYFDLRDTLDFRPYTDATVGIVTDVNSAPLNPAEANSDIRYNYTIDKKFPIPHSVCDITVERYLPRIDSVVLYGNSAIKVIKGVADLKPQAPKIPKEGLLLNHLIVQPYPSLPKNMSGVTTEYVNRNVLNVVGINKRKREFTITTPITPEGLPTIQSKRYTMEDISSLERRIADLEYYTSLSFTEDRVTGLELTSSVDPTTNRFKFGFFVDNFTTSNFAEVNDPSYYAQIFGYELNPKKKQFKIEYKFNTNDAETVNCLRGKKVMLPSRQVKLIGQNQATESTTIKVATTETTFTTTGTEITKTTTTVKEITTEEWELKTQEQQFQTFERNTSQVTKKVIKVRYVTKDVPGNNASYYKWYQKPQNGTVLVSFTASKFGGTVTMRRGGQKASGAAGLQRYMNGSWQTVVSGGSGQAWPTFTYTYGPSTETQFQVVSLQSGGDLEVDGSYPTSTQTTVTETYEDTITVTEDTSRYEPKTQTIYQVNKETNTTIKEEIIVDTTIEEKTTSVTKSLFNPKPSALLSMQELFNTPASLNSPTVDLLAFIQDDINS